MTTDEKQIIKKNIEDLKKELGDVVLCAVTKYHDLDETKEVIKNGVTVLGENKVQDLVKKIDQIEEPVHWHMIGHLQTNKVKNIVGKVDLIQSVDSLKVLRKINDESKKKNVVSDVLIQYNLTGEDQKFGFSEDETGAWIDEVKNLPNIRVEGIMGMGPHTDSKSAIREVFRRLKSLYDKIDSDVDQDNVHMKILSMGMSDDYPIALDEGSSMVRIGSKIFT